MYGVKAAMSWVWCPILITALAIVGCLYEWPIEVLAPIIIIILAIGLVLGVKSTRDKELRSASLRLKQLAGYFHRRFMGNSPLSIFAIIDTLFSIDNPRLWDWARACDISQRVFDTWCSSFINRVESDIRTRGFDVYLNTYLNELWLINSHYYEFIEQFYEIGDKVDIPNETVTQYNRFVTEYNAFIQDFRDNISELRQFAKTGIEPPSVQFAKELSE